MNCPKCNHHNSLVIETRKKDTYVRRRRKCPKCKHRWTTFETEGKIVNSKSKLIVDNSGRFYREDKPCTNNHQIDH